MWNEFFTGSSHLSNMQPSTLLIDIAGKLLQSHFTFRGSSAQFSLWWSSSLICANAFCRNSRQKTGKKPRVWLVTWHINVETIHQFSVQIFGSDQTGWVADPGGPGGPGPPCPQKDFFKIMQFSGNCKGKPLFWANFWFRASLGVTTPLGPSLTKILDPRLWAYVGALAHNRRQTENLWENRQCRWSCVLQRSNIHRP